MNDRDVNRLQREIRERRGPGTEWTEQDHFDEWEREYSSREIR